MAASRLYWNEARTFVLWAADSLLRRNANCVGCGHGSWIAKVALMTWTRSIGVGRPMAVGIATLVVSARSEGGSIGCVLVSSVEGDGGLNGATICWDRFVSQRGDGEFMGVEGVVVFGGDGTVVWMGVCNDNVLAWSMSMGGHDASYSPMSSWASRSAWSLALAIFTGLVVTR
jgi:hypothetical protein